MGEREKAFRQRIARIQRIENLNAQIEQYAKEDEIKQNNLTEIMPAICGIKKNMENFRTKETLEEVR